MYDTELCPEVRRGEQPFLYIFLEKASVSSELIGFDPGSHALAAKCSWKLSVLSLANAPLWMHGFPKSSPPVLVALSSHP